jgi:hypothetical protein
VYSFHVKEDKWGPWFQRAIRVRTVKLSIRLDLPADRDPNVWGIQQSLTAGPQVFRTPIRRRKHAGRILFEWNTEHPPMNARFRFEWKFRAPE